ncbi:MAG: FAD-dependent monooxygenase [Candidatus Solibacter sp.]
MPSHISDVDVLIVGAGPVGLFLANECSRRGLRFRLIEARASQSEHSKALAIFPRTLEILDMAGLVDPFLETANRVTSVAVSTHGHTLAQMRFAPQDSPYSFIAMVPQNITEGLLVKQLVARGGSVEYEKSFVSAVQEGDIVRTTIDCKGTREEMTAAFIVGCDGAHSAVRHLLKLSFEGAQYNDLFLLADVESNETLPACELQLRRSQPLPAALRSRRRPIDDSARKAARRLLQGVGGTSSPQWQRRHAGAARRLHRLV